MESKNISTFLIDINLPHLVDDGWLEVHEDGPGHVLAGPGLGEEGVEAVITSAHGLIRRHLQGEYYDTMTIRFFFTLFRTWPSGWMPCSRQ